MVEGDENRAPDDGQFEAWTPVFDWRHGEPYVIGFMKGVVFQHPQTVKATATFVPSAPAVTRGSAHLDGTYFTLSSQLLIAKEDMRVHAPFVTCEQLAFPEVELARFVSAIPPEDKHRAGASTMSKTEGPRGSVWLRAKRLCVRTREQDDTAAKPATVAPETESEDAEDDATDSEEDTDEEPVPAKRRKGLNSKKVCWSPRTMHRREHRGSDRRGHTACLVASRENSSVEMTCYCCGR